MYMYNLWNVSVELKMLVKEKEKKNFLLLGEKKIMIYIFFR
jgi:hypothetical protein